jgi:hypothetical protein
LISSDGACAYVASCLSEHVQEEYADALGVSMKGASKNADGNSNTGSSETGDLKKDETKNATRTTGAWGVK